MLDERNGGEAVYSYPWKTAKDFGNDYETVRARHVNEDITWYHIDDEGFTRTPGKKVTIH